MKLVSRWATVVALLLVPTAVFATVVIGETIEDMARASTMVVRGRVLQVQPQLEERSGRINTYADIQVIEVLKGPRVSSVLVKQPGGEIGNRGTHVAGAGQFKNGEDTVVFLEQAPDEPGVFILRALAAGKVDFEKSSKGELKAVRHLGGLAFHDRQPNKDPLRLVKPDEDLGPPDVFLTRIRNALKDGAK
jgi:hypothetical protein